MLIRFNIENFLSFNKKVEFSMIANKERRLTSHLVKVKDLNLLKSAVIYGANASGKSNLVKSIDFAKKIITEGLVKNATYNYYFRLQKNKSNEPTTFNFEIKSGDKFYSYGFAIQLNTNVILEEWLYEISNKKEQQIFYRFINDAGKHEIEIGLKLNSKSKKRFDVYKEDFKNSDNLFFLSEMNRKSVEDFPEAIIFKEIFDWFDKRLTVLYPDSKFAGLNFIGDDAEMSDVYKSFLSVLKTGIAGIVSEEIDLDRFDIPELIKNELVSKIDSKNTLIFALNNMTYALRKNDNNEYKIKKIGLEHLTDDGQSIIFDFEDESDGTQRLFDFIPALVELTKRQSVFIIDELDRSLHSKLTYALLELFLTSTATNESQLIATTHESLLLDLNLLRRDEIWFIEKNEDQSRLYSLDEFKVRNDKVLNKDYLIGRYGAIPIFKSFTNIKF